MSAPADFSSSWLRPLGIAVGLFALAMAPAAFAGFSTAAGTTPGLPAPGAASRCVFGDFNNDGRVDVFYQTVGNGTAWAYGQGNANGTFTVYTSTNATGVFANATSTPFNGVTQFDFTGTGAALIAGDFNGDGRTDIWFTANGSAGTILWNGASGFTSAAASTYNFPAVGATSRLVAGDFNNDGITDLFYQTVGNGTAWAYAQGSLSGTFTVYTSTNATGVFANAASTPFNGVTQFDFTGTGSILRAGDFNGDGKTDIWWHVNSSAGTVLWGGASSFTSAAGATYNFPAVGATSRLVTGDFNSDGIDDLFYQTVGNGTAWGYAQGNSNGIFSVYTSTNATGVFANAASTPFNGVTQFDFTGTGAVLYKGDVSGDADDDFWFLINGSAGTLFTQNGSPPLLTSSVPADNAVNVSTTTTLALTFDQTVAKGTGDITVKRTSDNVAVATIAVTSGSVTGSGATWTVATGVTLANSTSYYVQIAAGAFVNTNSQYHAGIASTTALNFTTVAPAPVINSTLTASGTYRSALGTYTITATNTPTSYSATGLPAGLSINTSNGQITGTPTTTVGSPFSVTLGATNAGGTGTATLVLTIAKVGLTVANVTANNKAYDATTVATLNTGSASLVGVIGGDTVTLGTGSATGAFATKTVGTGKTVTVSGLTISGASSANYTLTQPTTTANISAATLTVTGITANNKVYNATTAATLVTGSAALSGVLGADTVTLNTASAAGAFATKTVGTSKTVTVSGLTISGTDSGNYTLTQPTTPANITAAPLAVVNITANNKVYDTTTAATLNTGSAALSGVLGSDTVTLNTGSAAGAFATKTVGTGKPVTVSGLTISGTDSGNYSLTQPTTTAAISAAALTVTGITANNKVYNATTTATLVTGTAALSGVLGGDTVTLNVGSATGAFASKTVGTGKTVTVSGLTISGTDSGNYSLTQPTTTADITVAGLTVTGVTANDKVYDTTTAATLTTGRAALSGVVGGDTVTLNTGSATGVFDTKNTGTSKAVTVAGLATGGADSGNYTLTQPATTASITAKGLTVTADGQSRVYGTANPALTAAITGFAGSENSSVLTGSPSVTTTATAASLPGTYAITVALGTLAANNGNYTFSFADGTLTVTALTYATWKTQMFSPSEQGNPAISDPDADPDGDGTINLLEYAFALDPLVSDRTGLPAIGTAAGTYATITYPRRFGTSDLTYAPQVSTDLSTWSGSGVTETGALDQGDTESVTAQDGGALGAGSRRFLRIQVASSSAAQPATTDPLGAVALTVQGAGTAPTRTLNFVGLPLTQPVVYQGRVSSASGTTLTQSGSTWADDAFDGAAGAYFVEIASGGSAGITLDIVATSASSHSLTLAEAVDSYAGAGDVFKVRRHATLANVFGAANEAGLVAGPLSTGDLVQVYLPTTQTYASYYYQDSGPGGAGWRSDASASADAAATPLFFGEGFLVRKQTAALTWILTGAVKTGPTILSVAPGLNVLPNVYPAGSLTLGGSQLYTGSAVTGLAGGSLTTADLVSIYNATAGTYTNYYYKTLGLGGTGWRANTSLSANAAGTAIPIGGSVLLQRKSAGSFLWLVPQPF